MTKRVLVIGLGNTLSGDDGFGSLVVERLRRDHAGELEACDLLEGHTDLLARIDSFRHYERVMLVDVLLDPQSRRVPIGSVIVLGETDLQAFPVSGSGPHSLSPLLALKLYRRIYGENRPEFSLISLCTDQIEIGRRTNLTDAALDEACHVILRLLAADQQNYHPAAGTVPPGD